MLRSRKFTMLFSARVLWGLLLLAILILAGVAFSWNRESVFFDGQVYFTDGDCYARMTRVRQLQDHPFTSIRTHSFENYPDGTRPHTTAPLDLLIALLTGTLRPFASQPLALAGALISPLLGLLTLFALAVWANALRLRFRAAMLFLLAVSPIMAQGFLLGRPDHQSLLLFLVSLALAAEAAIWLGHPAKWRYLSALAWGLALWVSLFEPLILLAFVRVARGIRGLLRHGDAGTDGAGDKSGISDVGRASGLPFCQGKTNGASAPLKLARFGPLGVFAGILLVAWAWDGWRAAAFDPHFNAWTKNIGELRHGTPAILFSWTGWLLAVGPPLLAWQFWKTREPLCLFLAGLILVVSGLTLEHLRWGYFLVLVFGMSLPWVLAAIRWKGLAWLAFAASLWPVAGEWDRMLYPDDEAFRARGEGVADAIALRDAALSLRGLPERGVVAPWWFSPAVVWWSGQPCVGGTSHQSLPGIADSSEVFLATNVSKAKEILARRKAGYLIAYEPERVVSNAAQILGIPAPAGTLAEGLYKNPHSYTGDFKLLHRNRFFRVYEILAQPDLQ